MSIFNGKAEDIFNKKTDYPVGSVCMFNTNIDPNEMYGGTWVRIKGKFIFGADDDTYPLGSEGGEATHTLTVDEMPSHEGHLYQNVTDIEAGPPPIGTFAGFLEKNTMAAYPNGGRGWNSVAGNEIVPAGVSRGGDQPHNNMPPYVAFYIWAKVA